MKKTLGAAMLIACLAGCPAVWADTEPPAIPGTQAGANLPWPTSNPPATIQGPGIYTDSNGNQVDLLGISGGRWGATGDEVRALNLETQSEGGSRLGSIGWLGLLGLAGLIGRWFRKAT
jgi:MYXO-CTERM domain-containing protein